MNAKRIVLAIGALIPFTATAMAHPVHGASAGDGLASGFLHPWLGLDHLLAMIAVGLLAVQTGGRALWMLPLSFLGAMVLGGAVGVAGWDLRLAEVGIALSVICLGVAVALWRTYPLAGSAAAVALFGIFHGHAHGVEMPALSVSLAYFVGFILGTALLHALGIGIGVSAAHRQRWISALRVSGAAIACAGVWLLLAIA